MFAPFGQRQHADVERRAGTLASSPASLAFLVFVTRVQVGDLVPETDTLGILHDEIE